MVEYKTNIKKVFIVCPKHGKFLQTPEKHMSGCGCPKFSSIISKPESILMDLLGIPQDDRQVRIKVPNQKQVMIVDGLDRYANIIYQLDGDYWHGNPAKYPPEKVNTNCKKTFGQLFEETQIKTRKLENMGFVVIRIWESDLNKYLKG